MGEHAGIVRLDTSFDLCHSFTDAFRFSFASVHMLYVNTEVNGQPVKAFVDSGAQATISATTFFSRSSVSSR